MGAGLIDKQRAQKIKTEKRKKAKQKPKGQQSVDEAKQLAQQAQEEKAARDRELNRQRQEEAEQKAIRAQIKQLIDTYKIDRQGAQSAYQFEHDGSIKQIMINDELRGQIARGNLAIAVANGGYELIPEKAARKIQERDASYIALLFDKETNQVEDDDPYAEFQVPDDLMW